jgi:opacity protein-like surface antigen
MKKWFVLFCLLAVAAAPALAQESRQDVSMSAVGTYQPTITGNGVTQKSTWGKGALLSYRFMLTPLSAIEGNYQYSQFDISYTGNFNRARVHSSMQEMSAAYVRYFVYKNFNPFVEGGVGLLLFRPIDDTGTTTNAVSNSRKPALLFGGGIAYELSPSWDLRLEYRAFALKSVDFGLSSPFQTNRYYIMQQPTIGFAYHF